MSSNIITNSDYAINLNSGANTLTLTGLLSITGNVSTGGNLTVANNTVINGNLLVNGNTTIFNANVISTNDKSITLANNQSSAANVDGAGIDIGVPTIVSWQYNNATTSWQTNVNILPTSNVGLNLGGTSNYWNIAYVDTASINNANISGNLTTGNIFASSVSASGNIIGGNVLTNGLISAAGNIDGGNLRTTGLVSSTGNITGGNLLTGGLLSAAGNVDAGNLRTTGLLSATGDVTAGNISTAGVLSAAGNVIAGNIVTLGLISAAGNIISLNFVGNLVPPAGGVVSTTGNITGGNLETSGLISAAGNVDAANFITIGLISATGNIRGGNVSVVGSIQGGSTGNIYGGNLRTTGYTSATGDVIGGNILTGGLISSTGNINSGNLLTAGLLSAVANITAGNILTGGTVSAVGNVDGGNVNTNTISGTELTIKSAGNLNISSTGNVVFASNVRINNVGYPAQDADAATKLYVDNMASTGLSFHQAVAVATTTTLASATSGTITYTQPNGVANGVGAVLTTTGTFNLIDTANVQTIGTRILVKDEANAVFNGVYTWANATNIVRSADADQYGSDSSETISLNDYFFVSSGTVNGGSAYVVDAPTGNITFGTSNIAFAQFSQASLYNAGTGLTLANATFSVNASQTQITAVGNLGSLIVTGNTTGGNLITGGVVTATGNVEGGNLKTGGLISAAGNITGGNVLGGANVNATTHTGTTVSVTANVTGGNVLTGGLISAASTITGSQFNGSGAGLTSIPGANVTGTVANATYATSAGSAGSATTATTATYVTGLTSGNVTTALTFTPYNATNPSGYQTTSGFVATVSGASQGNITSVGTLTGLTINNATTAITNGATAGSGNIGASGAGFNTVFAKSTSAQYADLAEKYLADQSYEVGTVLAVGGNAEVTACSIGDRAIGAVSENPAFKMNDGLENGTYVALKGRVPVKVIGTVRKGQRLVAHNNGCAVAGVAHANDVFAVALESSDDTGIKLIESIIL